MLQVTEMVFTNQYGERISVHPSELLSPTFKGCCQEEAIRLAIKILDLAKSNKNLILK